jgi:hypothetical protein
MFLLASEETRVREVLDATALLNLQDSWKLPLIK